MIVSQVHYLRSIKLRTIGIWFFPSGDFQLYVRNFRSGNTSPLLTNNFPVWHVYYSNTIIINHLKRKQSFYTRTQCVPFISRSSLRSRTRIFIRYLREIWKTWSNSHRNCHLIYTFVFSRGMRIQKNNIAPATSWHYTWYPVVNNYSNDSCTYKSPVSNQLF